jgi:hypothetical protein
MAKNCDKLPKMEIANSNLPMSLSQYEHCQHYSLGEAGRCAWTLTNPMDSNS